MDLPTDADKQLFREIMGDFSEAQIKPMFGALGAFVNGNLFACLLGSRFGVKLIDPEVQAELMSVAGSEPFAPGGRAMKEYVTLPEVWASSPEKISEWALVALVQVRELPPK